MLFRRLAAGVALLVAALASQLPEFTQQYSQRLGGAIDELAEDFDPQIAQRAYASFEPALPLTVGGLAMAAVGFLGGWLGMHGLALPFRRRHRPGFTDPAHGHPR